MSDFKERVINECDDLEKKIDMLIDFMHGDIYPALSATDQGLLMVQLSHMKAYANVLRDRIERFTTGDMRNETN
jgi:hypothetical protein